MLSAATWWFVWLYNSNKYPLPLFLNKSPSPLQQGFLLLAIQSTHKIKQIGDIFIFATLYNLVLLFPTHNQQLKKKMNLPVQSYYTYTT